MGTPLDCLSISGFKSIRELNDLKIKKLNVLIGANGAGKSNFVELFRMLRAMVDQDFESYVLLSGGANSFMHNGPKVTPQIESHFVFGANEYRFVLQPAASDKLVIKAEAQKYAKGGWDVFGRGEYQSNLRKVKDQEGVFAKHGVGYYVYEAVSGWTVYHFHDTGKHAPMRGRCIIQYNKILADDAANAGAVLLRLRDKSPEHYDDIVNAIRLVMPFFDNFLLDVVDKGEHGEKKEVGLDWRQKGSNFPMQPYQMSDGSIRFICLAIALLQPNPPSTIIIDEPELGLHPAAIAVLAELMQDAAKRTQVIVSTQSPTLVDHFGIEDVIVVNRKDGASTFERLDEKDFSSWLEEYTIGELWTKNVITGGPVHE